MLSIPKVNYMSTLKHLIAYSIDICIVISYAILYLYPLIAIHIVNAGILIVLLAILGTINYTIFQHYSVLYALRCVFDYIACCISHKSTLQLDVKVTSHNNHAKITLHNNDAEITPHNNDAEIPLHNNDAEITPHNNDAKITLHNNGEINKSYNSKELIKDDEFSRDNFESILLSPNVTVRQKT